MCLLCSPISTVSRSLRNWSSPLLWTCWKLHYASIQGGGTRAEPGNEARAQDVKDIREFVNRYFRTWSEQDMRGYDACFLPDACIHQISNQGDVSTMMKRPFVASQREYHQTAPQKAIEVPVSDGYSL